MANTEKPIIAIMYDFDKTLSKSDMQDYGFIPALGLKPAEFWGATGKFQNESGMERILSYMYTMVKLAKEKGIKLTRETLNKMGENIEFFDGVETWFDRINKFGESVGVTIQHFIISSGTKEIVDGSKIAKYFKEIFGCEFYYDPETNEPVWPLFSINYTQKTQYIYRIRKGVTNLMDDSTINTKTDDIKIPYENMIYLGDGMTDIPCMQLIQNNHGHSIAIYSEGDKEALHKLIKEKRTNIALKANYEEGGELEKYVKDIISAVAKESYIRIKNEEFAKEELGSK